MGSRTKITRINFQGSAEQLYFFIIIHYLGTFISVFIGTSGCIMVDIRPFLNFKFERQAIATLQTPSSTSSTSYWTDCTEYLTLTKYRRELALLC